MAPKSDANKARIKSWAKRAATSIEPIIPDVMEEDIHQINNINPNNIATIQSNTEGGVEGENNNDTKNNDNNNNEFVFTSPSVTIFPSRSKRKSSSISEQSSFSSSSRSSHRLSDLTANSGAGSCDRDDSLSSEMADQNAENEAAMLEAQRIYKLECEEACAEALKKYNKSLELLMTSKIKNKNGGHNFHSNDISINSGNVSKRSRTSVDTNSTTSSSEITIDSLLSDIFDELTLEKNKNISLSQENFDLKLEVEGGKKYSINNLNKQISLLNKTNGPLAGFPVSADGIKALEKFNVNMAITSTKQLAPDLWNLFQILVKKNTESILYNEESVEKKIFIIMNILLNTKSNRNSYFQTISGMTNMMSSVHKEFIEILNKQGLSLGFDQLLKLLKIVETSNLVSIDDKLNLSKNNNKINDYAIIADNINIQQHVTAQYGGRKPEMINATVAILLLLSCRDKTLDTSKPMEPDINKVKLGSLLYPSKVHNDAFYGFLFNIILKICKEYFLSFKTQFNKQQDSYKNMKKERNTSNNRLPEMLKTLNAKFPPDIIHENPEVTVLPLLEHNEATTDGWQAILEEIRNYFKIPDVYPRKIDESPQKLLFHGDQMTIDMLIKAMEINFCTHDSESHHCTRDFQFFLPVLGYFHLLWCLIAIIMNQYWGNKSSNGSFVNMKEKLGGERRNVKENGDIYYPCLEFLKQVFTSFVLGIVLQQTRLYFKNKNISFDTVFNVTNEEINIIIDKTVIYIYDCDGDFLSDPKCYLRTDNSIREILLDIGLVLFLDTSIKRNNSLDAITCLILAIELFLGKNSYRYAASTLTQLINIYFKWSPGDSYSAIFNMFVKETKNSQSWVAMDFLMEHKIGMIKKFVKMNPNFNIRVLAVKTSCIEFWNLLRENVKEQYTDNKRVNKHATPKSFVENKNAALLLLDCDVFNPLSVSAKKYWSIQRKDIKKIAQDKKNKGWGTEIIERIYRDKRKLTKDVIDDIVGVIDEEEFVPSFLSLHGNENIDGVDEVNNI